MKKVGRSWLKMVVYPVARPAGEIADSMKGIKEAWARAEEIKRQKEEDAKAVTDYLKGKSPSEKFEEIYVTNQWTAPELRQQARAARNARLACLGLVAFLLPVLVWVVATSALWVSMLSGLVMIMVFAAAGIQAARFAWWEAQIAERSCFPMREFFSRPDLIARVFRL